MLAAWARRYLPEQGDEDDAIQGGADTVVARTRAGGFKTDLMVAGYPMVADEPASYGGTKLGPTPYDYLSAALASCTSMTLKMYAEHKKLDLRCGDGDGPPQQDPRQRLHGLRE